MLKLHNDDITLSQSATDKFAAIARIAQSLTDKGLVAEGYVQGMLNREKQNSTFLGNGIAIPHGTTDTRELVKTTGVAVHHFPQGVDWGDNNKVYVAIGIAAKSDEHLAILKQLTKVLGADGVEARLREAQSAEDIIALLHGEVQFEAECNPDLVQLNCSAGDLLQMSAIAGGLLANQGHAANEFVADLVTKAPTDLGKGLWLVASDKGVTRSAVSFVSAADSGLIAVAACNNAHLAILKNLSQIIVNEQQQQLLEAQAEQVIALLKGEDSGISLADESDNVAIFTIKNAHGLHARPGAMLVAETKKFEAKITVVNLDGDGKPANAKSLMKVIALGVKQGHRLQFAAEGADAKEALAAIGQAIASGLGEG